MNLNTEIYTVGELESFMGSESYLSNPLVPLSKERILSQLANPRAEISDPVLFILRQDDRILAYRSLLPDSFQMDGSLHKFAWLSGNFVDPEFRRQGHSTRLFKSVEEAWECRLMYTNYAPASKAVYDATGSFVHFLERPGRRYYVKSALKELLKERVKAPGLLGFADGLVNGLRSSQSADNFPLSSAMSVRKISTTELEEHTLAKEVISMISETAASSFFGRGVKEFEWIQSYPWVRTSGEPAKGSYAFTHLAEEFSSNCYIMENKEARAFIWLTRLNDKASLPYFFVSDPVILPTARQFVLNQLVQMGASYITTRDPLIGPLLGLKKNPFIYSRKMPQHYFVHKNLHDKLPENPLIYDGDGDCVFS